MSVHANLLARLEYLTIVSIIVAMTVWDFVIGVLFGIVMSCKYYNFVILLNSLRRK
jgi:sulfate permease, SulP family